MYFILRPRERPVLRGLTAAGAHDLMGEAKQAQSFLPTSHNCGIRADMSWDRSGWVSVLPQTSDTPNNCSRTPGRVRYLLYNNLRRLLSRFLREYRCRNMVVVNRLNTGALPGWNMSLRLLILSMVRAKVSCESSRCSSSSLGLK